MPIAELALVATVPKATIAAIRVAWRRLALERPELALALREAELTLRELPTDGDRDPQKLKELRRMYDASGAKRMFRKKDVLCGWSGCAKLEIDAETKFSRCAGCNVERYCSKACQVAHWKAGHKKVCKKLKAAAADERKE